jgi:hypothetical protein
VIELFSLSLTYVAILISQVRSHIPDQIPGQISDQVSMPLQILIGDRPLKQLPKQTPKQGTTFLAFGGGGAPSYNEIALEKNLLYFQRTLKVLGFNPADVSIFFANGNDRQSTIRYLDPNGNQKFKPPEIPNLKGASTLANLQAWLNKYPQQNSQNNKIFFYFTGHGHLNEENANDNSLMLWQEQKLSVKQFSSLLDRLPTQTPIAIMMAQCYSGSFANIIYEGGDPQKPLAKQNRCGFYATIRTLPSVGCTAEVNESDYRDYSSSFFAGLSGRSRTGQSVPSADYNKDGRVAYNEAHAFAKIDEKTTDLPVSTSEVWLQTQSSRQLRDRIFSQPITTLLQTARPEQRYVVEALVRSLKMKVGYSLKKNRENFSFREIGLDSGESKAYFTRLQMELINIGMESQIRTSRNSPQTATLDRLLKCESDSWHNQ